MIDGPQPATELENIPSDELSELLDMRGWSEPTSDRELFMAWRAELLARADRDVPPVRLAADGCLEHLAGAGSLFAHRIGVRVVSGLNSAADRPPLLQDN